MNKSIFIKILALFFILFFAACGSDSSKESSSSSETKGTLKLNLTDKPAAGEFQAVNVEFEKIMINKSADAEEGEKDDEKGGWTVLNGNPGTINLLELTNGKIKELGVADLEPGQYNQIRIYVKSATVKINDKEEPLKIASNTVKLVHPFTIEKGIETVLIADFDAHKSIKSTGKGYLMTPVIRLIEEKVSGAIEGVVTEPLDRTVTVSAIKSGETEPSAGTVAADDGKFLLGYLAEGTYNILIEASGYLHKTIEGITVVKGEKYVIKDAIKLEKTDSEEPEEDIEVTPDAE